tara:strand:+ start:362 stop:595 length:234 start_codon:yes stop_codon:yes gene_type:complete
MAKPGLYANIQAKRKRIKEGSGETMRKVGTKGAPSSNAFVQAAKTAKPVPKKSVKMASQGGKINKSTSKNSGLFGRK